LQNVAETSAVIVPKAQISPDQSWEKIDEDVIRSNLIYFYPEKDEFTQLQRTEQACG
jgi:hypothetical protein